MEDTRAFNPQYSPSVGTSAGTLLPTVTVSATTSATASAILPGTSPQLLICNQTTGWAYVNFGVFGNVTAATAASLPIAPGICKAITIASEVNGASVILATGTGSVSFTRGGGL